MKIFDSIRARTVVLALACCMMACSAVANTNVVVWDTMKGGRQDWKKVPSNLMELEKDPLKSASDPGYYGRDYTFSGDVVVENEFLTATFSKANGKVKVTAKPDVVIGQISPENARAVQEFELIRNAGDEVRLALHYGKGDRDVYSFGRSPIIEVKSSSALVTFTSHIDYTIVPGFVGDDLIFSGNDTTATHLSLPADNLLVNLISGEKAMVVMTWPGKKAAGIQKSVEANGGEISEVAAMTKGEPIYIAALAAPGIWHREKLDSNFLEKDVTIDWKAPFSAKWQTQLSEGSVTTTYAFRHGKGTVWRGVPGSYNYPVWFEDGKANFSLSKKVPPKGEAVIYFLEGNDTPAGVLTPADVLKETLGRPMAESLLDVEGRKLRTHHGSCGSGVHRACTCGYTEAIQAVFEKGEEGDRKDFVDESIRDMIYFVQTHLSRIDEYRAFAKSLTEYLHATAKSNPELKEYLDDLDQTVQQIPAEYENQKENMKGLTYAAELQQQTMALTGKKQSDNLKQYMELLKAWRAMGGAQDYVVAQYHMITRRLFQEAGYNAAAIATPKAIEVAEEIRARTKQVLRNPDGYEIWPNY